jgi:hypothetical protein
MNRHGPQKCSYRDPTGGRVGAKNRKFRVSRGSERSPDSDSAHRELSNGGVASKFGTQKRDFVRVSFFVRATSGE